MKKRQLLSWLLLLVLFACSVLTGCSGKETMFSTLKKASQISSFEFQFEGSFQTTSSDEDEEDTSGRFVVKGATDGKSAHADMTITQDDVSITLEDFIRFKDNTVYLNMSSITTLMGMTDSSSFAANGLKKWISIPVSEMDADASKLEKEFYSSLIDSLEKACSGQDISKDGDTWTLDIPSDKVVSFCRNVLKEVNANLSDWYDQYVEILEKSGYENLLKEYEDLAGGSLISMYDSDDDEDPSDDSSSSEEDGEDSESFIQQLKDSKNDNLATWKETASSLEESLNEFEQQIKDNKASASSKFSIALTGKEGSRKADYLYEVKAEGTEEDITSGMSISMKQSVTETGTVTVEAPDSSDVMTFSEFSDTMSSYMESMFEVDDDGSMTEEEEQALRAQLKGDNELLLYDSDYEDMTPYILTFDNKVYEPDDTLADYSTDLSFRSHANSYVSLYYSNGSLKEDMGAYYLDSSQPVKTMKTGIGEVSYATTADAEDDGYSSTVFGIQLDSKGYLLGTILVNPKDKLDVKDSISSLLKDIRKGKAVILR